MTMIVGGNLEQLQALEQQLQADAQTVRDLQARISSVLGGTTWTGPASERFRAEWTQSFGPALGHLGEALSQNAGVVRSRKAAIQQATF